MAHAEQPASPARLLLSHCCPLWGSAHMLFAAFCRPTARCFLLKLWVDLHAAWYTLLAVVLLLPGNLSGTSRRVSLHTCMEGLCNLEEGRVHMRMEGLCHWEMRT